MNKIYDPKTIEAKWYQYWEKNKLFAKHADNNNSETYCIIIPPPNVTGHLHMGHAFQLTLIDILIRYNRMLGKKTLWQVGTDHAGIATQMVVERQLEQNKLDKYKLGREKFIEKIWEWKTHSGNLITNQIKRMGASVDWSREKFTMDPELSAAVTKVFVDLYNQNLIYKAQTLVNWDPVLKTAISDLEVINTEESGKLWHIKYNLADTSDSVIDSVIIATTRPETLLGDTAVAVNPKDERYKHLIGKNIIVPIVNRHVPIIADDYVDQEFGSGVVKITPAHDYNDFKIGKKHNLPVINILTPEAKINQQAPKQYHNLDRFAARELILTELNNLNLLIKTEDHILNIPRGDRSHAIIEPYLTSQWFVKIAPLAKPAISAVENNNIKFIPKNWVNTYYSWMYNIQDWCISRQLWWGHRIPAWYDEQQNIYVGLNQDDIIKKYNLDPGIKLTQDPDVLDTWFSSALWPFASLGWPKNTQEFKNFYPNNVLVTGFDIIFFWVARMIMMGLKFTNKIPFYDIYIHGLIRDNHGHKMSKSKGNIIDPLDLIDGISLDDLITKRTKNLMQPQLKQKIINETKKDFSQGITAFGTDALRFTFCALASTGRDINFDQNRINGYRNFCNKIWNAAKFIFLNCDKYYIKNNNYPENFVTQAITSQLQKIISLAKQHLKTYRFDLLANILYDFIWHEFCDWYIEITKIILYDNNSTAQEKHNICLDLLNILNIIVKLLHPIIPFITEEIWQEINNKLNNNLNTSIMVTEYPVADKNLINSDSENLYNLLKNIITAIRNIRGELNIKPNKNIILYIKNYSNIEKNIIIKINKILCKLGKIEEIVFAEKQDQLDICASRFINKLELSIPLAGIIDIQAEKNKLTKNTEKLNKELKLLSTKLASKNFLSKAPKELIASQQQRLSLLKINLKKLQEYAEKLNKLNI